MQTPKFSYKKAVLGPKFSFKKARCNQLYAIFEFPARKEDG